MESTLTTVDWATASRSLAATGSAHVVGALEPGVPHLLMDAAAVPWRALPPVEGVVRQNGFFSHMVLDDAEPLVKALGNEIVRELTMALGSNLPSLPRFNEVGWKRYPIGTGHITTHRDPTAYDGVVAIVTLQGTASFRVWGGEVLGTPSEVHYAETPAARWDAAAGDLVLLRGNGWPTPETRCPLHEVDVPANEDRIIVTFRHNIGGAGSGYEV